MRYDDYSGTGERSKWTFSYQAKDLFETTNARAKFHRSRRLHWNEEVRQLEAEIRDKGVELKEIPVTGGHRFEASVDTALGRQFTEAKEKEEAHAKRQEQYDAYVHEFERDPEKTYELNMDDLRFFGLVGAKTVRFGDQDLAIE